MEEDKQLKRIRQKKLKELIKNFSMKDKRTEQLGREATLNKPIELTDITFEESVRNQKLAVIDCWAPWCRPCQIMAPIIEEIAQDNQNQIFFGKLNVDENKMTSAQYQIMSIPTLLVFKNGKLVDRIIGAMSKQMLETKITSFL